MLLAYAINKIIKEKKTENIHLFVGKNCNQTQNYQNQTWLV